MTYEEKLLELAEADERIVVMTAENRAAIRNLPAKLGDRFIDVGIAESTMIGAAAGLALRGRKPIVHALATFLTSRAYEFIRDDVGIAKLPVILVGGVPGFFSEANGPTHQAIEDIALMRSIPGMNIFCPAHAVELVEALPHLFASGEPWYIRYYAGKPTSDTVDFAIADAEPFPWLHFGEGEVDVTILTYGFLVAEALKAKDTLHTCDIKADVLNMRTIVPIDEWAVLTAAEGSRLVVTLEDHFRIGGLSSIVTELLQREGLVAEVMPIALEKWFKPALLRDVLEYEGFTGEQIAERIRKRLAEVEVSDDNLLGNFTLN